MIDCPFSAFELYDGLRNEDTESGVTIEDCDGDFEFGGLAVEVSSGKFLNEEFTVPPSSLSKSLRAKHYWQKC